MIHDLNPNPAMKNSGAAAARQVSADVLTLGYDTERVLGEIIEGGLR